MPNPDDIFLQAGGTTIVDETDGRSKGGPGRNPKAYWEQAIIEAAFYMFKVDVPKTQGELESWVSQWLIDSGADPDPNESTVREHVGPLYRRFTRT